MVSAVIITGRSRCSLPRTSASSRDMPCLRSVLTCAIRTMALFTTIPASRTSPSIAVFPSDWPVSLRVTPTPMKENGIENMITAGWRKLSKSATMIR